MQRCAGAAVHGPRTYSSARPGNNPYCYHRAAQQARAGIRERLTVKRRAPGIPFDHALFAVDEEPAGAPWASQDAYRFTADRIQWNSEKTSATPFNGALVSD